MLSSEANAEQGSDLKTAFLRHLPERIGGIEDNWNALVTESWDPTKLARLFLRIQDLAGQTGKHGLIQVSQAVYSLEQYFRDLLQSGQRPSDTQQSEFKSLIQSLKSVVGESRQNQNGEILQSIGNTTPLYYLRVSDSLAPGLAGALESLDCSVTGFRREDDMLKGMDSLMPAAIILDAQLLNSIDGLKVRLNKLKVEKGSALPLTVISSSSKLDIRLQAMRSGAVAFFVPPLDIGAVAARIKQLAAPEKKKTYRIMIVDDDPSQADFAAAILRKADMETCTVTEPLQVLNTLEAFRPDLILMDLYMPDADGMELTSIIREQNEFVGVPIVFVSGEQDTDKQLDALSVGGDDFIAKPIRPKHLMSTIKNRVQRARALQKQVSVHTARDPITGLFNRRYFFERLDKTLASNNPHPVARGILYANLDNKEHIQQQIGIGQTDALMAEIGAQIAKAAEPQDVCARTDDNGFAIIAKRPLNQNIANLGNALVQTIGSINFDNAPQGSRPTISMGLCLVEAAPDDASGLLGRAENAARHAAELGGNRLFVHGSASPKVGSQQTEIHVDPVSLLQEALREDSFQVLFQPFVDLRDKRSENYQMTLRLRTEEGDQLGPADFMPAAQKAGLNGDIDQWLVGRALDVLDERRQSGDAVRLAVALSNESLRDTDQVEWLRNEFRKRLLVGTGLILEFNLIDVAGDLKGSKAKVEALKSMGVSVCLDRFGHNDASYKITQFLGAEYVKVGEKMLLVDSSTTITLIKRVHQIGARVIVPRVDDPKMIGQHWLSGADFVQGNAIQRPTEATDYDFSGSAPV